MLTTKELADRTGIPAGTLENWRYPYKGVGPRPVKVGHGKKGSVRYRLEDVIAWENSLQTVETKTQENALAEVERVA